MAKGDQQGARTRREASAGPSPLMRLRAYLDGIRPGAETRLPPERALCLELGLSRGQLRRALAALEADGLIWRHVGKGTFLGHRPADGDLDIAGMARRTNPVEIMQARLAIEPEIAAAAALVATTDDLAAMRTCLSRTRAANDRREYDVWNVRLHRAIAVAAHNTVLLAVADLLASVRGAVKWGHLTTRHGPMPTDHYAFEQHEAIVSAIELRDVPGARRAMRLHLQTVENALRAREV